jgi:uncharacterized OB-fold protein
LPDHPTLSPLATYLDHLGRGELAYQVAGDGTPVFFPRVLAPGSGDTKLDWRVSKGLGTVYATTVVHPRGEPALNVVLIDMDEGYRLMSRVDDTEPSAVAIGLRVQVRVQREGESAPYPVFVPAIEGAIS